jgi:DNA-binding transcriptional LysR family regulator
MQPKIDWESQIGRRLRFRDLHVFFTIARQGSMAKAATTLGVAPPTISEVVADLEHALGVPLFDRGPRGVEPNLYGRALLKRGLAAFDELKQGIREIEFLADPTVGELRIGCDESLAAATVPAIIDRFSQQYPAVVLDVSDIDLRTYPPSLKEQGFDLVLTRLRGTSLKSDPFNELHVETLFEDELVIAAGEQTRWAGRRKIDIAELADMNWILTAPGTWNYEVVAEAFRLRELDMPKVTVKTLSVHLRAQLLATGRFVAAFPRSVLRVHADRYTLKELSVALPSLPWPVVVLTLANRTIAPVVERFITCAREATGARVKAKSRPGHK